MNEELKIIEKEKLASGSFGIVYKVSISNETKGALKRNICNKEIDFMGSLREMDILSRLDHPNIISLHLISVGNGLDVSSKFSPLISSGKDFHNRKDDTVHFLFEDGIGDLHDYIYHKEKKSDKSKVRQIFFQKRSQIYFKFAKQCMFDTLQGLKYIHEKGIIHRDIKPSNIIIFYSDENETISAKICDFGLSKINCNQESNTPAVSSHWYRSPEMSLAVSTYDKAIDIWAAGVMFYELIVRKIFLRLPDSDGGTKKTNLEVINGILRKIPDKEYLPEIKKYIEDHNEIQFDLGTINYPNSNRIKKLKDSLGMTDIAEKAFYSQCNRTLDDFCDLLGKMITFIPEKRITAEKTLEHNFFSDFQKLKFQRNNPSNLDPKFDINECVERQWMSEIASDIFNNRSKINWYTHRILFQSIFIFDEWLVALKNMKPIYEEETEINGLYLTKRNTYLYFLTVIYIFIKTLTAFDSPSFNDIVTEEFKNEVDNLKAEKFENYLVMNYRKFRIISVTIFEFADTLGYLLQSIDIKNILTLYLFNEKAINQISYSKFYEHYWKKFRQVSDEDILEITLTDFE